MIQHTKRVLRIAAGTLLIVIGVVCVILPVIPGWPLIIPGLLLVGVDPVKARRWAHRLVERYPRLHQWAQKFGYRPPPAAAASAAATPGDPSTGGVRQP